MPRTHNGGDGGRGSGGGRGNGRLNLRFRRKQRRRSQNRNANNHPQESMDFEGVAVEAVEAAEANESPSNQVIENLNPLVPYPSPTTPPADSFAEASSSLTGTAESPPKSAPASNKKQRAESRSISMGGHGASTPIRRTTRTGGGGGGGGDDVAGITDGIGRMQTPSGETAMPSDGAGPGNANSKRVRGGQRCHDTNGGDDDDNDDNEGVAIEREAVDVGQMRVPTAAAEDVDDADDHFHEAEECPLKMDVSRDANSDVAPPSLPRVGAGAVITLKNDEDKVGFLVEYDQVTNKFGVWDGDESISFYSLDDVEISAIFGIGSSLLVNGKDCTIIKYHPTEGWAIARVRSGDEEVEEIRFYIKPTSRDGDGRYLSQWEPSEGYGVEEECVHWVPIRSGATLQTRAEFTSEPEGIWSTCSLVEYDPDNCMGTLFYHSTNLYEVGVDLCKVVYRIVALEDSQDKSDPSKPSKPMPIRGPRGLPQGWKTNVDNWAASKDISIIQTRGDGDCWYSAILVQIAERYGFMLTVRQFKDLIAACIRSLTADEFKDVCHTAYDPVSEKILSQKEYAKAIQSGMEGGGSLESFVCSRILGVIVVHAVGGDGRDDCVHVFYSKSSGEMMYRCLSYENGLTAETMPFVVTAELLFGTGDPTDHPDTINFGGVVSAYDPSKCTHLLQTGNHYEPLMTEGINTNLPSFRFIRHNLDLDAETTLAPFQEWPTSHAPSFDKTTKKYHGILHLAHANHARIDDVVRLFESIRMIKAEEMNSTELLEYFLQTHKSNVQIDSLFRVQECVFSDHPAINALRNEFEQVTDVTNANHPRNLRTFILELVPPVDVKWTNDSGSPFDAKSIFVRALRSDPYYTGVLLGSPLIMTRARFLGWDMSEGAMSKSHVTFVQDSEGRIVPVTFGRRGRNLAIEMASSIVLNNLVQQLLPGTREQSSAMQEAVLLREYQDGQRHLQRLRETFMEKGFVSPRNSPVGNGDSEPGQSNPIIDFGAGDDDEIGDDNDFGVGGDGDFGTGDDGDDDNIGDQRNNSNDRRRTLDPYWCHSPAGETVFAWTGSETGWKEGVVKVFFHSHRQYRVKISSSEGDNEVIDVEYEHVRKDEPADIMEEPAISRPWDWSPYTINLNAFCERVSKRLVTAQIEQDGLDITEDEKERIIKCLQKSHKKESWDALESPHSSTVVKAILSRMFPIEDIISDAEAVPNMSAIHTVREFVSQRETFWKAFDNDSERWKRGVSLTGRGGTFPNGLHMHVRPCYKFMQEADAEGIINSTPSFKSYRNIIKLHLMYPHLKKHSLSAISGKKKPVVGQAKKDIRNYWIKRYSGLASVYDNSLSTEVETFVWIELGARALEKHLIDFPIDESGKIDALRTARMGDPLIAYLWTIIEPLKRKERKDPSPTKREKMNHFKAMLTKYNLPRDLPDFEAGSVTLINLYLDFGKRLRGQASNDHFVPEPDHLIEESFATLLPSNILSEAYGHAMFSLKEEFCGKTAEGVTKEIGELKALGQRNYRIFERSMLEFGMHMGVTFSRTHNENVSKQISVKREIANEKGTSAAKRAERWAKRYGKRLQKNGIFIIWKDFCAYVNYKMIADPYENGRHASLYDWLEMDKWERRADEYLAEHPNVKLDEYCN